LCTHGCGDARQATILPLKNAPEDAMIATRNNRLAPEELMFCDGCGTAVQPGQSFCSRCGKQILGSVTTMQPMRGRVQEHAQLVGILWMGLSAFNLIAAGFLYVISNTILTPEGLAHSPEFLRPLLTVVVILLIGKAALGFVGGWGLMAREPWARIVVLVLAFISLFTNIPFGTALGIYTMWVLLPGQSQQEYDALVAARAA
jgi:predicted nucleic acid-binding Zn ribbon protein